MMVQGVTLLVIGPFLDRYVSGEWASEYIWTNAAVGVLALSCFFAIFVNLSQFACLGRFSAVSYQVRPHLYVVHVVTTIIKANPPDANCNQ